MPDRDAGPRNNQVTASDLVRHFGTWQERAVQTPVYVMFRGRPKLVLTSIDLMQTLLAPHSGDHDQTTLDPTALLDLIHDMVIVTDGDLHIIAASRAARRFFGEAAGNGHAVETLVPGASRDALLRSVRTVQAAGREDSIELPTARAAAGPMIFKIEPHRSGVAVLIVAAA